MRYVQIATQIWTFTAFSECPHNVFIVRFSFIHLKNLCKALHKFFYGKKKIMQSNQQKPSWESHKHDLALHKHFT